MEQNEVVLRAQEKESFCVFMAKPQNGDKLIECHSEPCNDRKLFHMSCLNYKRMPNNAKTTWQCNGCKLNSRGKTTTRKLEESTNRKDCESEDFNKLDCQNVNFDEPIDLFEPNGLSESNDSDGDLTLMKVTTGEAEKMAALENLTEKHYKLISFPDGWFDCDVIYQVKVYLREINFLMEGFQRPTLGRCRNFNIVSGEFIQILHTGNSHWVCVSSIGCLPGIVNLYDSSYHNIMEEVEVQVVDLVGEEHLKGLAVVPVQQQPNESDCGVFAPAFATCLVHYQTPETLQFDRSVMRQHLLECLVAGKMTLLKKIVNFDVVIISQLPNYTYFGFRMAKISSPHTSM